MASDGTRAGPTVHLSRCNSHRLHRFFLWTIRIWNNWQRYSSCFLRHETDQRPQTRSDLLGGRGPNHWSHHGIFICIISVPVSGLRGHRHDSSEKTTNTQLCLPSSFRGDGNVLSSGDERNPCTTLGKTPKLRVAPTFTTDWYSNR